jgi:hypothetical protein
MHKEWPALVFCFHLEVGEGFPAPLSGTRLVLPEALAHPLEVGLQFSRHLLAEHQIHLPRQEVGEVRAFQAKVVGSTLVAPHRPGPELPHCMEAGFGQQNAEQLLLCGLRDSGDQLDRQALVHPPSSSWRCSSLVRL